MSSFQRLDELLNVEHLDDTPEFALRRGNAKGKFGVGIRYELKIHAHLSRLLGGCYVPGPWFRYRTTKRNDWNYAQPDGLFFDFARGRILIIEVKYAHTPDSYFQLNDKYLPLMRKFFGTEVWHYAVCEVVFWYDKAVVFPCRISLRKELKDVLPGEFGVHICRP